MQNDKKKEYLKMEGRSGIFPREICLGNVTKRKTTMPMLLANKIDIVA